VCFRILGITEKEGVVVGFRVKMDRRGMLDTWKSEGIYYPGAGKCFNTTPNRKQSAAKKILLFEAVCRNGTDSLFDDKLASIRLGI
jgi:hypothetical protein